MSKRKGKKKKTLRHTGEAKHHKISSPVSKERVVKEKASKEKTSIFCRLGLNKLKKALAFLKEKISKFREKKKLMLITTKVKKVKREVFVKRAIVVVILLMILAAVGIAVYGSFQEWKKEIRMVYDLKVGEYSVEGWFKSPIGGQDHYLIVLHEGWFKRVVILNLPPGSINIPSEEGVNPKDYILVVTEKDGKKTYELKKLEGK